MAKFKIGDKFAHLRKGKGENPEIEIIGTGTIKSECIKIGSIDHYQVEWDITDGIEWANTHRDIICDVEGLRYYYTKL